MNLKTGIFLPYTIKTAIAGITRLMAPTGRIYVFTVMMMNTAGGFSEIISRGKVEEVFHNLLFPWSFCLSDEENQEEDL